MCLGWSSAPSPSGETYNAPRPRDPAAKEKGGENTKEKERERRENRKKRKEEGKGRKQPQKEISGHGLASSCILSRVSSNLNRADD